MARILLVHWKAEEAEDKARPLRGAGHTVECYSKPGADGLRELRELRADPPDAIVIDLSRLPSHGRAVATFLRQQKATRSVPLVFVAGDPEKIARLRSDLPDATYADWRRVRGAVRDALRTAPASQPVVPGTMQGYSGTPLPKKLGIKPGAVVALCGAPKDFDGTLGSLPDGARVKRGARGTADVVLLFCKTRAELTRRFAGATRAVADGGKLWIVWPKQASGVRSDLNGNHVRAFGLARAWVDFKICAVDATWSGLCFARRGGGRAARRPGSK